MIINAKRTFCWFCFVATNAIRTCTRIGSRVLAEATLHSLSWLVHCRATTAHIELASIQSWIDIQKVDLWTSCWCTEENTRHLTSSPPTRTSDINRCSSDCKLSLLNNSIVYTVVPKVRSPLSSGVECRTVSQRARLRDQETCICCVCYAFAAHTCCLTCRPALFQRSCREAVVCRTHFNTGIIICIIAQVGAAVIIFLLFAGLPVVNNSIVSTVVRESQRGIICNTKVQ